MGFQWDFNGISMGFQWDLYGIYMGLYGIIWDYGIYDHYNGIYNHYNGNTWDTGDSDTGI